MADDNFEEEQNAAINAEVDRMVLNITEDNTVRRNETDSVGRHSSKIQSQKAANSANQSTGPRRS